MSTTMLDIHEILKFLPHRYPFLMIDRVLEYEVGQYLKAVKNVTMNEPFFPGHFPRRPVMPGVLILESMAQATGMLAFLTNDKPPSDKSLYYLVGIDKARFKKPVEPGDQLVMHVTLNRRKNGMWKFASDAMVDETVVASAELMCAERDVEP